MGSPRIIWDSNNIDLDVDKKSLQITYKQAKKQNRAGSGIIETINQHGIMEITFDAIFDEDTYRDLIPFWAYARQGQTVAFYMDSDKGGNTTLEAAAAADQKTINNTDYPHSNFTAGDYWLIRAEDSDDEFEIVEIDTITTDNGNATQVTVVDNLFYSYSAGDTFRYWEVWPKVILLNDEFNPQKENGIYRYQFRFAEDVS